MSNHIYFFVVTMEKKRGLKNNSKNTQVPFFNSLSTKNKIIYLYKQIHPEINMRNFHINNYSFIDLDVLIAYISEEMRVNGEENVSNWDKQKPPDKKIINALKYSDLELSSPSLRYNLLPRAVLGHAREGHSLFRKRKKSNKYPNVSLNDIIKKEVLQELKNDSEKSIYKTTNQYLTESQDFINSIVDFLTIAINSYKNISLADSKGQPILGLDPSLELELNPIAVLKGYYFGAHFDNYQDIRKPAEERYGLPYGGGTSQLINLDKLKKTGISLEELAKGNFSDEVLNAQPSEKISNALKKLRIIKKRKRVDYTKAKSWRNLLNKYGTNITPNHNKKYLQQYIRTAKGRGGADDVLIRLAAFIDFDYRYKTRDSAWYNGLQIGAQLADFVDTLEKAASYYLPDGQDESSAKYIEQKWLRKARNDPEYRKIFKIKKEDLKENKFVLVDKEQIIRLTALGINPKKGQIHSSARYFLREQEVANEDLDNSLTGKSADKYTTNTITQEMLYMQDKLSKMGVNMADKKGNFPIKGKLCENSDILIGFHKIPLKMFISYMDENVIPYAKTVSFKQDELKDSFLRELYK